MTQYEKKVRRAGLWTVVILGGGMLISLIALALGSTNVAGGTLIVATYLWLFGMILNSG